MFGNNKNIFDPPEKKQEKKQEQQNSQSQFNALFDNRSSAQNLFIKTPQVTSVSNPISPTPFGTSLPSSSPSFLSSSLSSPFPSGNTNDTSERLKKSEETIKNLKAQQDKLRKEFEDYKQSTPTMKQLEDLKKQLTAIKNSGNNNLFGQSRNPFENRPVIKEKETKEEQVSEKQEKNSELRDSISELKKICTKKETQLEYAIAIIEKQQKTIEAQTIKISGLQTQIENGFAKLTLQLGNMNFKNPSPQPRTPFDFPLQPPQMQMPSFPTFQQQQQMFQQPRPNQFYDMLTNPYQENTNLFHKKQTNPMSQSAVFQVRPQQQEAFDSFNNTTYKEDGYMIKYRTMSNNMIQNLEISNFLGKIEVLQPIDKKFLTGKRISQIVNIGSNVCEIIDHEWDNFSVKLTTFNFMNMQQMSLSERVELNKKVKQQAESTGLDYYLDGLTGNLEIVTKPKH